MNIVGLVGGLGPESTIDYYRRMVSDLRSRCGERPCPEVVIYSADLKAFWRFVEHQDWEGLTKWLAEKVRCLSDAGAELAAVASNSPHVVFEQVRAQSPIPLVSIVEATCAKAESMGLRRLGLLGTKMTMQLDFYARAFAAKGMGVVVPGRDDQQFIQEKLFSEIVPGIIRDPTREALLGIVQRMIEDHTIDGVILGCTELPLILPDEYRGIPFLNTTAIHVEAIVRTCLGGHD